MQPKLCSEEKIQSISSEAEVKKIQEVPLRSNTGACAPRAAAEPECECHSSLQIPTVRASLSELSTHSDSKGKT